VKISVIRGKIIFGYLKAVNLSKETALKYFSKPAQTRSFTRINF